MPAPYGLTREEGQIDALDVYELLRDFGPHSQDEMGAILGDAIPAEWLANLLSDGMASCQHGTFRHAIPSEFHY